MKQKKPLMLFTLVERRPTKGTITFYFGQFWKIVLRVHDKALPRVKGMDLVAIYYPKMDWAYEKLGYSNVFSGRDEYPRLLGYLITTYI